MKTLDLFGRIMCYFQLIENSTPVALKAIWDFRFPGKFLTNSSKEQKQSIGRFNLHKNCITRQISNR